MTEASEYEVRCPRCNVSFPIGTRSCLHCGGPTAQGAQGALLWRDPSAPLPFDQRMRDPGAEREDNVVLRPLPMDVEPDEVQSGRARLLRAGVTVMWVLLAVGFSLVRACSEK